MKSRRLPALCRLASRRLWSTAPLFLLSAALPVVAHADTATVTIEGQPPGSLTGKRIIIDPGHGIYYHPTYSWLFQRDPINGLHEDKHTNEIVLDWLRPQLEGAGARVLATRSPHRQTVSIIVDESDPGYSETGTWTKSTNPGLGYRGSYRYAVVSPDKSTATATFSTSLPERGEYPVWVYYYAGADRSQGARFVIKHAGGSTTVRVNQQQDRQRWVYLGTYPFVKEQPATVTLDNQDAAAPAGVETLVIADAVRFGVGMGDLAHDGKTSGQARWVEESYYYMLDHGAPESVYKTRMTERDSGLVSRPLYADWQGGDAFVSIHTNAADMPNVGSGLSTYIHSTKPSAGSDLLQRAIHDELLRTTRQLYVPTFKDRGKLSADFAVVRETKTMPAVLLELAFHDTEKPDAELLRSPKYRRDLSRAIYKGVLRHLQPGAKVTPLAPTILEAKTVAEGEVRVRWQPQADPLEPDATATSYRLFLQRGDYGFGSPVAVSGTEYTLTGLHAGDAVAFAVRAVNAGGESLSSEPLALVVAKPEPTPQPMPMPVSPPDSAPDLEASGCGTTQARPRTGWWLLPLLLIAPLLPLRRRRKRA